MKRFAMKILIILRPTKLNPLQQMKYLKIYTSLFNQRTAQAFAKWYSIHSVSFLKAKPDRNSNSRKRQLCRQFIGINMQLFAEIQSIHFKFEKKKKNDYEIIGYVCKSPSDVDPETRLKLLQKIVDNLLDRSLVDKVYVSVSSLASSPFNERDLNKLTKL